MNWQKYWVAAISGCVLLALTLDAQSVELQKCEWLSNQAYSQAWQRDAGVTAVQLKLMIRRGDERPEVKQGLIALSRYVFSHREMTPDDLADDLLTSCRSYDE
jgi:hypothetical protein